MNEPKYFEVLKYLYEQRPLSVHYIELTDIVFSESIKKKYRIHGKIDRMVCLYMGKLSRKDYVDAEYRTWSNGATYFVGYYIRPKGEKLLREKGLT